MEYHNETGVVGTNVIQTVMFIPLFRDNKRDALIWNDENNDMYIVRSSYC